MPSRSLLIDTSHVLALDNRDDPHHTRAIELARTTKAESAELVLHWGIVFEVADGFSRIGRRARGYRILEVLLTRTEYRVVPIDQDLFDEALKLYNARPDKEWGLTDCVSFVLMRREKITDALTADVHFRQAGFIPLLLEPDAAG